MRLPSDGSNDPVAGERTTAPLLPSPGERTSGPLDPLAQNALHSFSEHPSMGAEAVVPYRSRPLNAVLTALADLGLSRVHRHLLLLVDGQRSVAELMRLTGKSAREVDLLLRELEQAGLVQLT